MSSPRSHGSAWERIVDSRAILRVGGNSRQLSKAETVLI